MGVPKSAFEVRREASSIIDRVLGYRQVQVERFVRHYHVEHGIVPSYSMICAAVGISTKGEVSQIIASLERRGLLRRTGAGRVRRIAL